MKKLIFILMVGSLFGELYISPGFQLGMNSSKEFKKTRVEYFVEHEFDIEETIPA